MAKPFQPMSTQLLPHPTPQFHIKKPESFSPPWKPRNRLLNVTDSFVCRDGTNPGMTLKHLISFFISTHLHYMGGEELRRRAGYRGILSRGQADPSRQLLECHSLWQIDMPTWLICLSKNSSCNCSHRKMDSHAQSRAWWLHQLSSMGLRLHINCAPKCHVDLNIRRIW